MVFEEGVSSTGSSLKKKSHAFLHSFLFPAAWNEYIMAPSPASIWDHEFTLGMEASRQGLQEAGAGGFKSDFQPSEVDGE